MTSTKLKLIAIISMLIDHTAVVLFSDHMLWTVDIVNGSVTIPIYLIMRGIGRLAFPIFAFLIAEGYFYTRNKRKYFIRLLIFAFLSEIPYDLTFKNQILEFSHQNVFFTLAFGLLAIMVYEHKWKDIEIKWVILSLILFSSLFLNVDYSVFGVVMIFFFHLFRHDFKLKAIAFVLVNGIISIFSPIQFIATFSILILFLYNHQKGRTMKYLFYLFYPVHLAVLFLINKFF